MKHSLKKPGLEELRVRAHDAVVELRRMRERLRRTASVSEQLRKQSAAMREKLRGVDLETDKAKLKTPPSSSKPGAS